jgi:phosphate transport system substrate-binding protein
MRLETPVTAIETPHPRRYSEVLNTSNTSGAASIRPPSASNPPAGRASVALVASAGILAILLIALFVATLGPGGSRPTAATTAGTAAAALEPVSLRLHGSNTIGSELMPSLARAFLERRTAAKAVLVRRTRPDEMVVEARDGEKVLDAYEISAHGTRTAFEDLAAARCDVGMASSRIHEDEARSLAPLGNLMSAASEHVMALDGLAIIVNPANPVSVLTKTQIADVFEGKASRWSDVGGSDLPIVVHARDDKSGTYDSFKHMVLGSRPLTATAHRHESSEELSDAVAGDPNAVGFIGLSYVRSAKAVMVRDRGSAPLLPSPMTVATEDYPLSRRLYLYDPPGASQLARDFVDFALSEDGQAAVRSAGFVDLRPACDASAARCASCAKEYADAVKGACRVSVDFRFERGSQQLDTRGLGDLPRVVTLTRRPELLGHPFVLLGYSSGKGSRGQALAESERLASLVAEQLTARGLKVDVVRGMGSLLGDADEATDEERERARRVEVWVH